MKKQVLLFAAMIAGCALYAQSGNVGIGTSTPASKLSVKGNAGIGTNYADSAAPANGAIIQGNVGIGTATPGTNLQVVGGIAGGTAFGVTGTMPVHNIYMELTGNATIPAPAANGQMMFVKNNTTGNVTITKGYTGGFYDAFGNVDLPSMTMVPLGHKVFIGFIVPGFTGWIAQLSQDPSMLKDSVWNVRGNVGTNSGTNFLGTSDNASLSLRTNNVQRVYVDSATGNVGVGTAAPLGKFHVNGGDVDITNGASQWELNPSLGGSTGSTSSFEIINRTDNIRHQIFNNNGNVYLGGNIGSNSGTNATISAVGGNVGIGVTTPTAKLDVNGTERIRTIPQMADATVSQTLFADANGVVSRAAPVGYGEIRHNVSPLIAGGAQANLLTVPYQVSLYKLYVRVGDPCGNDCIVEFYLNISSSFAIEGLGGNVNTSINEPVFSQTVPTNISVSWPSGSVGNCGSSNDTEFNYILGIGVSGSNFVVNVGNNGPASSNLQYAVVAQRIF